MDLFIDAEKREQRLEEAEADASAMTAALLVYSRALAGPKNS